MSCKQISVQNYDIIVNNTFYVNVANTKDYQNGVED